MNLLDLIFPKKCLGCGKFGKYICDWCFSKIEIIEKAICPECERQAIGGKTHPGCQRRWGLDGLIVSGRYKGVVASAIQKVKYRWSWDIAQVLVDLLEQNIWRFDFPQNAILISVPLHSKREKWRGFNQAEILTRELSKRFDLKSVHLIERIVETRPQVGLSKKERKKNIAGAFGLREDGNKHFIKDKDFILVDDVFTSGATLNEICRVLKRAGARCVWGMTVALG